MRVGLILGGGGIVGIAWEIGAMAGLGIDPLAMDVIVGSSAGSVAGARVALGNALDDLVEGQRRTKASVVRPANSGIGTTVVPNDVMQLLASEEGTIQERAIAIGKLAIAAPVALPEDAYVESFRPTLGTDEWPASDLRVTTAECDTGRSVLWSKKDKIGLVRAVASSCAIPGYFPTVSFGGRRYTDGPRGGFYEPLVRERSLDGLLFIGPIGALPKGLRRNPEIDALAAAGLPVVQVTGGAGLAAIAGELMDPNARAAAVEIGLDDGRAMAAHAHTALSSAASGVRRDFEVHVRDAVAEPGV